MLLFPGQRASFALTLDTGVGMPGLQARVTQIDHQAFEGQALSADDRESLVVLYRTMPTCGRLSVVMGQAAGLLDHHLDGTGQPYRLEPEIFLASRHVRREMATLKHHVDDAGCTSKERHRSERFYMPESSDLDTHYGLYWGTLEVTSAAQPDGQCTLTWTARVPWVWPSFQSLLGPQGARRRENSAIPNMKSLIVGAEHRLVIDNALGGHLVTLGLAKPFTSEASWEETWVP